MLNLDPSISGQLIQQGKKGLDPISTRNQIDQKGLLNFGLDQSDLRIGNLSLQVRQLALHQLQLLQTSLQRTDLSQGWAQHQPTQQQRS